MEEELRVIEMFWTGLYWSTFVLSWVILPVLTSYYASCEFTILDKLKYAIKRNITYYVVECAAVIISGIIYASAVKRPSLNEAKAIVMALASAWGLIQIILFLSNGIVGIPRAFLRKVRASHKFVTLCCKLAQAQEIINENKEIVASKVKKLMAMEPMCSEKNKTYIEKIYARIPEELNEFRYLDAPEPLNMELCKSEKKVRSKIKSYNYKIKSSIQEYTVHKDKYYRQIKEAMLLKSLMKSKGCRMSDSEEGCGVQSCLFALWHKILLPIIYFWLCVIFTISGIMIILGECLLVLPEYYKYLSPLGLLLKSHHKYHEVLFVTVPTLTIFIGTIYYGLFNFRLSKFYGLFPYKQTDSNCLIYSALFTAKLAFPLCYNYLLIISLSTNGSQGLTIFESVMGVIDLVPFFGIDFQLYFPCALGLLLILNIFKVYGKIMRKLSLDNYTFIVDVSYTNYSVGKRYLELEEGMIREKKKKKNKTGLLNTAIASVLTEKKNGSIRNSSSLRYVKENKKNVRKCTRFNKALLEA